MDDTKKCRECGAELVLDEKITGVNPTVAFDEKLTPKSITQYRCTNLEKCHLAQIMSKLTDTEDLTLPEKR